MFAAGIYLLGIAKGNLYAFWLSAAALLLILVLVLIGRLAALRMRFAIVSWQARNLSARTVTEHQVAISPVPSIPFFRVHYRIRGAFDCGHRVKLRVSSENSAESDGLCTIPFYFPLAGVLHAEGLLSLRDIFGFIRIPIQEAPAREIHVKPPMFPVPEALRVDVTSSPEASKRQQTSDEDKYYMREYVPGDRMKDINWKASLRVYELITRISPVSPEPSRLIRIELRPHSNQGENLLTLLHLNYIKSWVLSFISAIHSRHPEYRFFVKAGSFEQFVEDSKDLETLAQAFCTLHFQGEKQEAARTAEEVFVFSTAFDSGLPGYIAMRGSAKTHLFRTAVSSEKKARTVQFFQGHPGLAIPGIRGLARTVRSFLPRKISVVPVRVSGFLMEEKLKMAVM